jgi:hypothetical protein
VRGFALILLVAFASLQFVARPVRDNPPFQRAQSFETVLPVPPGIRTLVRESCQDCHSNETAWPWYSAVAPLSWVMAEDVQKGRQVFNLSRFGENASPAKMMGRLVTMCSVMQTGRMPDTKYLWLHPGAKLSPAEIGTFCDWTKSEVKAIRARAKAAKP